MNGFLAHLNLFVGNEQRKAEVMVVLNLSESALSAWLIHPYGYLY